MNTSTDKRLTIMRWTARVGLAILFVALLLSYGLLWLRAGFADEQTRNFEMSRNKALQSDAAGAASCLDFVVYYYPSGTKQEAGSGLDRTVERVRRSAIRDIIAHLRTLTGEDLGESPEPWVAKYARQSRG